MSKPQPSISLQFGSEWRIRRPYLYRYLEKAYVEAFFETGALRLSSFSQFSKHSDEQRLDGSEGRGIVSNITTDAGGQTIMAAIGQGHTAYVLSASTLFSAEISKDFETDSGFRINDVLGFANAVSRHIPGFNAGMEGPCHYLPKRVLERDMGHVNIEEMRVNPDSKEIDMGKMMQAVFGLAGDDMFFLKHSGYASQNEYRLLWNTSIEVDGFIDIVCPEARQFCTRFEEMRVENGR